MVTTAKGKKVATIKGVKTVVKTNAKVKLVVKKKLKKGSYRFKVYVTDIAGNTSRKATAGEAHGEVGGAGVAGWATPDASADAQGGGRRLRRLSGVEGGDRHDHVRAAARRGAHPPGVELRGAHVPERGPPDDRALPRP